jgi:hypothetical protein
MLKKVLAAILAGAICAALAGAALADATPLEYGRISGFSEGLAVVGKDGKAGYIDKTGTIVIPLEYDDATAFSEGLAAVGKDNKWGYIDKTGAVVIPLEYDRFPRADDFSEGLAAVGKGNKWGYIDKTGAVAIPLEYDEAYYFSEGLAAVGKDDKWGYIDKTGAVAIPLEYNLTNPFSEDLAAVIKGEKLGFIDKTGIVAIPFEYDYDRNGGWLFSEGLATVGKDGKGGYIDKTGAVAVPFQYEAWGLYDFYDGFSKVANSDHKWGYIDKAGKVVLPLEYGIATTFSDGLAAVQKDGQWGIIDTQFNLLAGVIPGLSAAPESAPSEAASETPAAPGSPAAVGQPGTSAGSLAAAPTASAVRVNGEIVAFDAYNINGNNYFKLRDLAYALSGTEKQFDVGWDGAANAISLASGAAYTAVGGEMAGKGAGEKAASPTASAILLDGAAASFAAYNIEDNNYFKLRDIGAAFDFEVDWDAENQEIAIDTASSYTPD